MLGQSELSFEFFPPKTESGMAKLVSVSQKLASYQPIYCSVTFGAGGSTQSRTPETVSALQSAIDVPVVPHISCVGGTRETILSMLEGYSKRGVSRLVVLRGDQPEGQEAPQGELAYASDLVALIRTEFADTFDISVACYPECHPESAHAEADFDRFLQKVLRVLIGIQLKIILIVYQFQKTLIFAL